MIYKQYNLKDYYPNLKYDVKLQCMISEFADWTDNHTKRGIVILPGGGYAFTSKREADPVAFKYLLNNYNAYILDYNTTINTPDAKYPDPYREVACAFDFLRKNAEELFVKVDELGIIGFSAGGHLAGSYCFKYKDNDLYKDLNLTQNLRPDFCVLGYPVISFDKTFTHIGSRDNLTRQDKTLYDALSIEKNIDSTYPPTFAWHCKTDGTVPVKNSILLKESLDKANVKNELILYEKGWHGMSISNKAICWDSLNSEENIQAVEDATNWVELSCDFIEKALKNDK